MSKRKIVPICLTSALLCACSEVDQLEKRLASIEKTVGRGMQDASDVGVISELGWLSKLLRDSAQGNSVEKKQARQAVAGLFGLDEGSLGNSIGLAVTLQVSGYEPRQGETLAVALEFMDSPNAAAIAEYFRAGAGNRWVPRSIGQPLQFRRTEEEIEKLLKRRAQALVERTCEQERGLTGPVTVCTETVKAPMGDATLEHRLIELARAPYEVIGLPQAGSFDGQISRSWGQTSIGTHAVTFVPQRTVQRHPALSLRAWLHVTGHPDKIVGAETQVLAVDFVERCLRGTQLGYDNPTPPVHSLTSEGPLCWYAFDLFDSGTHDRLDKVKNEAARKSQA